jgi:hypothetical protein
MYSNRTNEILTCTKEINWDFSLDLQILIATNSIVTIFLSSWSILWNSSTELQVLFWNVKHSVMVTNSFSWQANYGYNKFSQADNLIPSDEHHGKLGWLQLIGDKLDRLRIPMLFSNFCIFLWIRRDLESLEWRITSYGELDCNISTSAHALHDSLRCLQVFVR